MKPLVLALVLLAALPLRALNLTGSVYTERGLTVNGTVRVNGKPLPGAILEAMTSTLGGANQSEVTDANGRFVLRGLVPARYTVSAYAESLPPVMVSLDPARQHELNLSLDPKPVGILFGVITGLPPAGRGNAGRALVQVETVTESAEGPVDEGGNYRIENAPSGTISVTAKYESTTAERHSPARRARRSRSRPRATSTWAWSDWHDLCPMPSRR